MKTTRTLVISSLLSAALLSSAEGAVSLVVNSFTDSQITVTVTGTLSGSAPIQHLNQLYVYSSVPGDTDWVLQTVPFAQATYSGSPVAGYLISSTVDATVSVGNFDYVLYNLNGNLVSGSSTFTGTPVTLTLPANTFNPAALDGDLVLAWGYNGEPTTPFGTFQAQAAVPEPASFALLGLAGLGLTRRRRARARSLSLHQPNPN